MTGKTKDALPKGLIGVALVLVLGAIAPMLDSTMVNMAVNDLGKDFNTSLDTIQWVATGYVLTTSIGVPFSGWLINRFDGKIIYMAAQSLFLLGSLLSGVSWNIESLIIFRLIQGFSAGLIIPLLTTLLVQAAGQKNIGKLMAIVGMPIIIGPILGPVIGGVFVNYLTWRWIFFINVPVCLIALYFIFTKLPRFAAADRQAKLDWFGILLLGVLSASFIYGITKAASSAGFDNSYTIIFVAIGIALLIGYIIYSSLRPKHAVVPLSLFKFRSFTASIIALFLAGIGTNGPMLLLPLFFQNIQGETVIVAALALIPQGLGMFIARPLIGKLIDKSGARNVVIIAAVITFIGTIPFLWFSSETQFWLIAIALFIRGIGVGGITIPVMADSYTGLSKTQIPQASVATRIIQNIGGAFGSAVLATVVAAQIKDGTSTLARLTTAYHDGFLVAVVLNVVIFIPALFLTNKKRHEI